MLDHACRLPFSQTHTHTPKKGAFEYTQRRAPRPVAAAPILRRKDNGLGRRKQNKSLNVYGLIINPLDICVSVAYKPSVSIVGSARLHNCCCCCWPESGFRLGPFSSVEPLVWEMHNDYMGEICRIRWMIPVLCVWHSCVPERRAEMEHAWRQWTQ